VRRQNGPVPSQLVSRRDVDFLLHEWLRIEDLLRHDRYAEHDRDTVDAVVDLAEEMAREVFAPINRLLDDQEPVMRPDGTVQQPAELAAALQVYAESGLTASTFDCRVGGSQLPYVVRAAYSSFLQASSIGAFAYPFLSEGNAHLLVAHGTPEQVDRYARPVIDGRWFGTMCLSEPEAGSSLADITTTAHPQPDGTFRLVGSKMWISGGDHELRENIVHLVLARTPDAPAGVRGISLFVVPKRLVGDDGAVGERNDVALVGLNHKMGYRGTTNTLLSFGGGAFTPGGRAGAVGEVVGEVGQGLALMFHMMNEARIGVGSGAVALGYAGYLHALDYARTRTQGRPLDHRDPASPPVPIIEHPDVRRMLLAQKSYVEGGLALVLYCARLLDEAQVAAGEPERRAVTGLLDLLTPVAKSWPSEWCLRANDLAIQVHGGYGYTRDFPVEQLYRDNRLNPIHEGTHGIQALDLLGRKVPQHDGAHVVELARRVRETTDRARAATGPHAGRLADHAEALDRAVDAATRAARGALGAGSRAEALANASYYLTAFGHVVVAWLWLEQELAALEHDGAFYDGKRAAARYFFAHELPAVHHWFDLVAARDRATLDVDPASL